MGDVTFFDFLVEGELVLEDQANPTEKRVAKKGDIIRVDKGTVARWSSSTFVKGMCSLGYFVRR